MENNNMEKEICFICETLSLDNVQPHQDFDSKESFKLYGKLRKSWKDANEIYGEGLPKVKEIPQERRHSCQICMEALIKLNQLHMQVQDWKNLIKEIVQAMKSAMTLKSNVELHKTIQKRPARSHLPGIKRLTEVMQSKTRMKKRIAALQESEPLLSISSVANPNPDSSQLKITSVVSLAPSSKSISQTKNDPKLQNITRDQNRVSNPADLGKVIMNTLGLPANQSHSIKISKLPTTCVAQRPEDPSPPQMFKCALQASSLNIQKILPISIIIPLRKPPQEEVREMVEVDELSAYIGENIEVSTSEEIEGESTGVTEVELGGLLNQIDLSEDSENCDEDSKSNETSTTVEVNKQMSLKATDVDVIPETKKPEEDTIIDKSLLPSASWYNCEYCEFTQYFFSLKKLSWHIRKMHNGMRAYKCDYCHTAWSTKEELNIHIYRRHTKKSRTYSGPKKKCKQCGKMYTSPESLREHKKRIHEGIRPFACTFPGCSRRFCARNDLDAHSQTHIPKENRVIAEICDICGKGFAHKNVLLSHRSREHFNKKKFKCTFEGCSAEFVCKTGVRNHMNIHTKERPFACSKCGKTFAHSASRHKHFMSLCSGDPELRQKTLDRSKRNKEKTQKLGKKCQYCPKYFLTDEKMALHLKSIHPGGRPAVYNFKCSHPGCLASFRCKDNLISHESKGIHMFEFVQKEKKIYECPMCKNVLENSVLLRKHLEEICLMDSEEVNKVMKKYGVSGIKSLRCKYPGCILYFTSEARFLKHQESQQHKFERTIYECPKCKEVLRTVHILRKHLVEVCLMEKYEIDGFLKEKYQIDLHECAQCNKKFVMEESLLAHVQKKHNPNASSSEMVKYKCPHCYKSFVKIESLENHIAKNHESNMQKCLHCDREYAKNRSLQEHVRKIHGTGLPRNNKTMRKTRSKTAKERNFNCTKCSRKFVRQEMLENHMRVKHPIKFKCGKCSKKFLQKKELDAHVKKVHSGPVLGCPNCSKTFVRQTMLNKHFQEKHLNE